MGYSALMSQALSAPPFLLAFVVVLVTAAVSDRHRARSSYLIMHAFVSAISYLTIALIGYFHAHLSTRLHTILRYICIYPAAAGFFSAITIIITWSMDNRIAHEGKGTGVALLNLIGQCGPLIGTRLYPDSDGPWFVRGMFACSMFMLVVVVLAVVLRFLLSRANRQMRKAETESGIEMDAAVEEGESLMPRSHQRQWRSSQFVYII
jgi:MFS family permease